MQNHYQTLGLNTSATAEEIRRAYRVLARRYHPDVNPGRHSEQKFKEIADAYRVLSDPERRRGYDAEFEQLRRGGADPRMNAYAKQAGGTATSTGRRPTARERFQEAKAREDVTRSRESPRSPRGDAAPSLESDLKTLWRKTRSKLGRIVSPRTERQRSSRPEGEGGPRGGVSKISVIEVSVTLRDVLHGIKKTVEISEPEGTRKVSVRIPPGVRNGSVVHLRSTNRNGEDLVLIVRVASHPYMSMHARGLVVEVPITVSEAIAGASITLPTLDEPAVVKVPPGSQSGSEIRLKGRGIADREGVRGDLFFRLLVRVPEAETAVGIREAASAFDRYYGAPVRRQLPRTLVEMS